MHKIICVSNSNEVFVYFGLFAIVEKKILEKKRILKNTKLRHNRI